MLDDTVRASVTAAAFEAPGDIDEGRARAPKQSSNPTSAGTPTDNPTPQPTTPPVKPTSLWLLITIILALIALTLSSLAITNQKKKQDKTSAN